MKNVLAIKNLRVSVDGKEILHGLDLTVKRGEIHAIMGPNGSGKSTMAAALAGHPDYQIEAGSKIQLSDQDLVELSPDERAQAGLFLAFQYPVEIPGVKVQNFLKKAYDARFAGRADKKFASVLAFRQHLKSLAEKLMVDLSLLERGLNEGFSGGEKKRLEILQLAVLEPEFAILDETDSGLDVDAIKQVAAGVKKIVAEQNTGILVITHYQRILDYLKPDFVHVLKAGKITQSGGSELAKLVEIEGYTQAQAERS